MTKCWPEHRGSAPSSDDGSSARYHFASADYFRAIGVPLLEGRFFNGSDQGSPRVVLVNQSLAKRNWPGVSAVGKRFAFTDQPKESDWFTVVGVVGDVKDFPTSPAAVPAFYWSMLQRTPREMILAMRVDGDPLLLTEAFAANFARSTRTCPLRMFRPFQRSPVLPWRRNVLRCG
jgi:putative ABC transport system permease protein